MACRSCSLPANASSGVRPITRLYRSQESHDEADDVLHWLSWLMTRESFFFRLFMRFVRTFLHFAFAIFGLIGGILLIAVVVDGLSRALNFLAP